MGVSLMRWLARVLIGCYPATFRRTFGREMQVVFDALLTDAARRGRAALLAWCVREFAGLGAGLLREQARNLRQFLWRQWLWLLAVEPLVEGGTMLHQSNNPAAIPGANFADTRRFALIELLCIATFFALGAFVSVWIALFGIMFVVVASIIMRGAEWAWSFGLRWPRAWRETLLLGIVLLLALQVPSELYDLVIASYNLSIPPDFNERIPAGDFGAVTWFLLISLLNTIIVFFFYIGYLVGRCADLFGPTWPGIAATILVSGLLFGSGNYYHPAMLAVGMLQWMLIAGFFLAARRNLWVVLIFFWLQQIILGTAAYFGYYL